MRTRLAWIGLAGFLAVTTASCSNPEADKQRYFESGNRYLADKKYQEAIVEFRNAVGVDDLFGEAHNKLGQAYEQSGDRARAYREFIRAADLLPDNADVQIKATTYLSLAGQLEDAKTRIQRLLVKEPRNVEAQVLLGTVLAGLKDLDGAVTQIEEAIQIDPTRGLSYTNLGFLQLAKGDRDAARAAFDKAVEVDPRSVQARLALAMFQLQLGEAGPAEESLKSALAIEPKHVLANRAMAALYLATQRAPEAEPYVKTIADASPSPQAKFALADYYLQLKRVDDAKATLKPLAEQPATAADAQSRLAQIEYVGGNAAGAHAMLDGVLSRHPQNAGLLLTKARWLLAEGKRAEAFPKAQAAAKLAPESPAVHYLLGVIYEDMQDVQAAIAAFNEVIRLNPRVAAAELHLSRLQLAQGAAKEAVQLAESALKNAPASGEARLTLARGLLAQRDHARAEPIVAELLKAFPKIAAVQALDGMLQLVKNNRAAARAAYERALQLDQGSFAAISGLIATDILEKKGPAAQARVEARLGVTPDNPALLMLASRVFVAVNEPAKAEAALRRVIQLAPGDLTAYSMLGQLYIAQRKLTEAQAEFDTVVSRNPKNIGARTIGAVIAHTNNSIEDAKKRYREILELDPTAPVAANNLAWIMAEEGKDLDEALRLAQQAVKRDPERAEIQDTLGWIYYKKELPTLAIPPFEASVEKDPGNPTYHYHLAMAHAKSGNVEQARRALDAALKLKPDFREARELQTSIRD